MEIRNNNAGIKIKWSISNNNKIIFKNCINFVFLFLRLVSIISYIIFHTKTIFRFFLFIIINGNKGNVHQLNISHAQITPKSPIY